MNQNQISNNHTPRNNIKENDQGCWAPTKAQFTFAWIDAMNSIIWNHEVYSCLLEIEKIKKNVEK